MISKYLSKVRTGILIFFCLVFPSPQFFICKLSMPFIHKRSGYHSYPVLLLYVVFLIHFTDMKSAALFLLTALMISFAHLPENPATCFFTKIPIYFPVNMFLVKSKHLWVTMKRDVLLFLNWGFFFFFFFNMCVIVLICFVWMIVTYEVIQATLTICVTVLISYPDKWNSMGSIFSQLLKKILNRTNTTNNLFEYHYVHSNVQMSLSFSAKYSTTDKFLIDYV